jgi:hypothetical protein
MNAILILFGIFLGIFMVNQMSCTNEDQPLDEYIGGPAKDYSDTELVAKKVTTAPNIDGVPESLWDEAQPLINEAIVPEPGDNVFRGYVGKSNTFEMRALYDDEYIYILTEWSDNTLSFNRDPWYFDPATSRWAQEKGAPVFNAGGAVTRDAFYEDKVALLWNVAKSTPSWDASTCYATCHTGLGQANGYARHYTNGPGQRIDMWHWKSVRVGYSGQWDDQYQDETQPNGRKSDDKLSGGYTDNVQELTLNGLTDKVKVPKYFIPNREYYYWIEKSEIDNGTAKLITGVDPSGVLYYDGGTIDPNTDAGFRRDGATTGAKAIPSVYNEFWTGSRGDVECKATYTGKSWILETRRKLNTGDTANQDVDFSNLEDQYFGIGIFENAQIAHSIKPGLVLKFEK